MRVIEEFVREKYGTSGKSTYAFVSDMKDAMPMFKDWMNEKRRKDRVAKLVMLEGGGNNNRITHGKASESRAPSTNIINDSQTRPKLLRITKKMV